MDTQTGTLEQTVTIEIPQEQTNTDSLQGSLSPSIPQETTQIQTEAKPQEISTEEKPKDLGGRPCEYCKGEEHILQVTQDYIQSAIGDKPKMLYLGELAIKLDRDDETLTIWANKTKEDNSLEHPKFSALIKRLQSIQQLRLQQRLMGRYNPTGAIFLLKTKHKYIETEKQILAGSHDPNEKLQIEFINEKPIPQGAEE